MITKQLTEQENELIEAIRNFRRAFPNGRKELEYYARTLFDEALYD